MYSLRNSVLSHASSVLKSNTKIVVTKTGVNKGNVRGIPKDIDTDIQQILIRLLYQ